LAPKKFSEARFGSFVAPKKVSEARLANLWVSKDWNNCGWFGFSACGARSFPAAANTLAGTTSSALHRSWLANPAAPGAGRAPSPQTRLEISAKAL